MRPTAQVSSDHNFVVRVNHPRGFTLVELLVAIAVLGLLVTVTVPAVSAIRQRANKMQCQANLREIGVLMQLYLDTPRNVDTFPSAPSLPSLDSKKRPGVQVTLQRAAGIRRGERDKSKTTDPLLTDPSERYFRCPIDEEYFAKEGISYEFSQRVSGKKRKDLVRDTGRSSGRSRYRPDQFVIIMFDFDGIHDGNDDHARNFLYLDWHVDDGVDDQMIAASQSQTNTQSGTDAVKEERTPDSPQDPNNPTTPTNPGSTTGTGAGS